MPVGTSLISQYYAPRTTFEGHLFVGPAGRSVQTSAGGYQLVGIVGDISITFSPENVDVTPRNSYLKMSVPGMADFAISFEYNWSTANVSSYQWPAPPASAPAVGIPAPFAGPFVGDPALTFMMAAAMVGQAIAVRGIDTYGGGGPDMDMVITKFDKKEGKGKQQTVEVELRPAIGYRDPNLGIYVSALGTSPSA